MKESDAICRVEVITNIPVLITYILTGSYPASTCSAVNGQSVKLH